MHWLHFWAFRLFYCYKNQCCEVKSSVTSVLSKHMAIASVSLTALHCNALFLHIQIQQTCKRMDSEICNVNLWRLFHKPQSTVNSRIFSKLEGNGAQLTVLVCHDAPQFFFPLICVSGAKESKPPKINLMTVRKNIYPLCMLCRRQLWFLRVGYLHLQPTRSIMQL